jgi:hypothetical protein
VFHAEERKGDGKILRLPLHPDAYGDDPFTALVEADKWFAENVEKSAP